MGWAEHSPGFPVWEALRRALQGPGMKEGVGVDVGSMHTGRQCGLWDSWARVGRGECCFSIGVHIRSSYDGGPGLGPGQGQAGCEQWPLLLPGANGGDPGDFSVSQS